MWFTISNHHKLKYGKTKPNLAFITITISTLPLKKLVDQIHSILSLIFDNKLINITGV